MVADLFLGSSIVDDLNPFYPNFQADLWNRVVTGDLADLKMAADWVEKFMSKSLYEMQAIGLTLLQEVALKSSLLTLDLFLKESCVRVNYEDTSGKSVAMHLLESGLDDIAERIEILFRYENALNLMDFRAKTPFHYLLRNKKTTSDKKLQIIDAMMKYDRNKIMKMMKIIDVEGESVLSLAVFTKDFTLFEEILNIYSKNIDEFASFLKIYKNSESKCQYYSEKLQSNLYEH